MSNSKSYVHRPHTSPMEGRMLFQLLDEHAAKFPDKEAFVYRDEKGNRKPLTYQQYQAQSQCLAASLLELGLARGDKALVLLTTSLEFIIVTMALNRIGALAIIVEPNTVDAVSAHALDCVFYTDLFSDVISAVNEISGEARLKAGVIVGASNSQNGKSKLHSYTALVQNKKCQLPVLAAAEAEVQFDDPFCIILTSGSTGIPKPIQYTNHSFVQSALSANTAVNTTFDSIVFCDSPFDWITGLLVYYSVLVAGATYVTFPPHLALQGHVTREILEIFEGERVSRAVLMSYFMMDMTQYGDIHRHNLSSLKMINTGGQLIDRTMLNKLLSLLPHLSAINIVYAATEFSIPARQIVTADNVGLESYGTYDVQPGWETMVVDSEGDMVPRDTPGELYLRGAPLYLNADSLEISGKRYKTPKTPTGWHHTNDSAAITSDGKLRIFGRVDNLIKCATESIQPAEVESVLSKHENVTSVVAVGVPDQRLYEVVCACVVLKSGPHGNKAAAIAELDEWCADKFFVSSIGLSSQPKHYVVLESFPNTRTGKTDRKALKAMAKERSLVRKDIML